MLPPVKLYNTLSRKKEEFKPLQERPVGLYTCGPTVYNYAHLGNLRSYIFEDILKRILLYNGYQVKHVMNVTDVGHLTGDRDMGEDKLEKGARREGKSAWAIAQFYWDAFRADLKKLNILEPDIWCRATDNIPEQIELIQTLEKKGFTYQTSDGVYFDTAKFPDYTKLSHQKLSELQEGARVEKNAEKKNPTDFALWKFSPAGAQRQMEWLAPWGVGFPGWHIECSAMSMKYLAGQYDIHCGGVDHINVHHTNEIAQSEAATGQKFFNYWLHGAFLNISGGKKMAKSADNFLTLENALLKKGLNPLAYRYCCLTVHYRKPMEYSEKSLRAAQNSWQKISEFMAHADDKRQTTDNKQQTIDDRRQGYKKKFLAYINDDLNMPKAVAVLWQALKDKKLTAAGKKELLLDFDQIFALGLNQIKKEAIPPLVLKLAQEREKVRAHKNWVLSDELRDQINAAGYKIEDTPSGPRLVKEEQIN